MVVTAPFSFVTFPLLLLAIILAWWFVTGRLARQLEPFDWIPAALWAIGVTSYTWSLAPDRTLLFIQWLALALAGYYATRIVVRDADVLAVLGWSTMIGGAVTLLIVLLGTQEGDNLAGVNVNFIAFVLCASTYLVIVTAASRPDDRLFQVVAIGYLGLVAYQLLILGSRGALVSFAAMLLWSAFALLVRRTALAARVLFGLAWLMAVLVASGLANQLLVLVDAWSNRPTGDLTGRLPLWELARDTIAANPLTGIGAGAFHTGPRRLAAHNFLLTLWLDLGVLGPVLFTMLVWWGVWPAFRRAAQPPQTFVLGLFPCFFFPIASSGHTEFMPLVWMAIAVTFGAIGRWPPLRSLSPPP